MADIDDNSPLHNESMLVPKKLLDHLNILAAVEVDESSTKLVYVSKKDCGDNYELNFALFENKRFKNGLLWMKEEALLPPASENKSLRVTGIGAGMYRAEIREILGLQIEFVEEFITHTIGLHFLISNFSDEEICHQDDLYKDDYAEFDIGKLKFDEKLSKTLEGTSGEKEEESGEILRLPALHVSCGSTFRFSKLETDGTADLLGSAMTGARSFRGLAKLLLGCSDYDEIMKLAEEGWRGNSDTQAKFLIEESSNYGNFPGEMSLFHFGKATDFNFPLSHFKRCDLAHSIVSLWGHLLYELGLTALPACSSRNIYYSGSHIRSWIARREIRRVAILIPGADLPIIKFLKNEYTGAIGAMLSDQQNNK